MTKEMKKWAQGNKKEMEKCKDDKINRKKIIGEEQKNEEQTQKEREGIREKYCERKNARKWLWKEKDR